MAREKIVNSFFGPLFGRAINTITDKVQGEGSGFADMQNLDLKELEIEAKKIDLKMFVEQSKAKVLQELAIAARIDRAVEVEIEEYYDLSGDVNAGVQMQETGSISAGTGASARKVTKRVIKFKGFSTGSGDDSSIEG